MLAASSQHIVVLFRISCSHVLCRTSRTHVIIVTILHILNADSIDVHVAIHIYIMLT